MLYEVITLRVGRLAAGDDRHGLPLSTRGHGHGKAHPRPIEIPRDFLHQPRRVVLFTAVRPGQVGRHDRRQVRQKIEANYERFPVLKEKRKQITGELSGGQQRMVEIGRTLMADPKRNNFV